MVEGRGDLAEFTNPAAVWSTDQASPSGLAFADGSRHPLFSATLGLSLLFVIAVTLHGEMYRLRPAPDHLTGVSPSTAIRNPLGVGILAGPVTITLPDPVASRPTPVPWG